ncbi:MAG: pantoate--beta-alanine ligase [Cytophagales bacterium]|nr:pantoate--beta-alanine ligase [Cytophagales bacterium]
MHIFKEIAPLRAYLNKQRLAQSTIGLVPTMGALHEGHLSLIRASKKENSVTVCSIYINPAQFGNKEDLNAYPRTLDADVSVLEKEGCEIVFAPSNEVIYGSGGMLHFDFGNLDKVLEGAFRPGHFSGVALVVSKLFNITEPDCAYFGQKDFQQFMIVSHLVDALKFKVQLSCQPIVREKDGLAMSSRNQRLSPEGRKKAAVLHTSLLIARDGLLGGKSFAAMQDEVRDRCSQQGAMLEYLALVDKREFSVVDRVIAPEHIVILLAAQVEAVRLIDNLLLHP